MIDPVKKQVISSFDIGDIRVRYLMDEEQRVGFSMIPKALADQVVNDDYRRIDPLAQLKIAGDAHSTGYSNGISLRNSATVRHELKFSEQIVEGTGSETVIRTILKDSRGIVVEHRITGHSENVLACDVTVMNGSEKEILLEMIESFSISDITPFEAGDAQGNMTIYKMRAEWANEGMLQTMTPEQLLLVPTQKQFAVLCERFGALGTKPLSGNVPFVAVEDKRMGVLWGGMLSIGSSWQIELYRRDNGFVIAGGIADADFGAWLKKLPAGESFAAPTAYMTTCQGSIDDVCDRFVQYYDSMLTGIPECEESLPIQYNEYRSSIGDHSYETIMPQARATANRGIDYFMIDAGWFKDQGKWYEYTGDWDVNERRFPGGLKKTTDELKELGFKPGVWFEPETCGEKSYAFNYLPEQMLHRYGYVMNSGRRRFWNLLDPEVKERLFSKIINMLKDNGFEYVKLDSNETVGMGCDGAESLGEALRQYSLAVEELYKRIAEEIPGIVIENCSAGAARAIRSFTGVSAVTSFSDAFSTPNNPIVAANMQRLIPARQSLIWCVVEPEYDEIKLRYSLTSATLGRMCISGKINKLSDEQNAMIDEAIAFYKKCVPVIKKGHSRKVSAEIRNSISPKGYQAIVRKGDNGQILVTVHTFTKPFPDVLEIELPKENCVIEASFVRGAVGVRTEGNKLCFEGLAELEGAAVLLK